MSTDLIEQLRNAAQVTPEHSEWCNVTLDNGLPCDCPMLYFTAADALEQAQQRWIPVSERLPDDFGDVLALTTLGMEVHINNYVDDTWRLYSGTVTHWMPLPQPPMKGEEP